MFIFFQNIDKIPQVTCPVLIIHVSVSSSYIFLSFWNFIWQFIARCGVVFHMYVCFSIVSFCYMRIISIMFYKSRHKTLKSDYMNKVVCLCISLHSHLIFGLLTSAEVSKFIVYHSSTVLSFGEYDFWIFLIKKTCLRIFILFDCNLWAPVRLNLSAMVQCFSLTTNQRTFQSGFSTKRIGLQWLHPYLLLCFVSFN